MPVILILLSASFVLFSLAPSRPEVLSAVFMQFAVLMEFIKSSMLIKHVKLISFSFVSTIHHLNLNHGLPECHERLMTTTYQ